MRIGIEAQRIFRTKKHGMDIVALELIKALQQSDHQNEYFIFVRKGEDNECLKESRNIKIIQVPGITYADWEQVFLPLYARKYKIDLLHCTANTSPLLYRGKVVITLHDVIFLERNQKSSTASGYQHLGRIYRKFIVPMAVKQAHHIITVSNYERNRIHDLLRIGMNNISVIYNSFGEHFKALYPSSQANTIKKKYQLPQDYIFYIGNTDPKKNIFTTIRAYRNYCIRVAEPMPLVIADISESFLDTVLEETDTRSLRKRIFLTGYIHNADLPLIYAGACLFLYPSLRESFGIPILEAMACGTPVITSNTTALPEIADNAAWYVDPTDEKKIGHAIMHIIDHSDVAEHLIDKGYQRIQKFNWQYSADSLLQLYTSL